MSLSLKLLTYTIFMYALILQKCFLIVYIVYIANIILIVNMLLQLGWCQSVWYMKTTVDKHGQKQYQVAAELMRDMGHKGNSCGGNDPHTVIQCLSPSSEIVLETPGSWLCCRSQSSCLPDPLIIHTSRD